MSRKHVRQLESGRARRFEAPPLRLVEPAAGIDAIVECDVAGAADLETPELLTTRIEASAQAFLDELVGFLDVHDPQQAGQSATVLGRRMPDRETRYFPLSLESLRAIGGWAADCAERALSVYETRAGSDSRPRAAIAGIRGFAAGGRRTARLRTLALEAHAAARQFGDPAASAAARAAGAAAASAYTHPLADVHQTKHIVGPAAYAALALELDVGDSDVAEAEVLWAIEHAPVETAEVLLQMPARQPGTSRLDTILYELDAGIRARTLHRGA